jgi:predicted ATPase
VGEEENLVEVLKGLMYFLHGRTELEEAGEAAGERLRISKRLGRPRELVAAYDDLATVAFSTGAFLKALTLCQHALELASNAASDLSASDIADSLKSVLILQSHTLAVLGQRDQALAACDRAMDIARELNHDYTLVTTLGNVCFVDQVCGRQAILSERAEEMIKVSEHRGFPTWKARGLIFRGWLKAEHEHGNAGLSEIHEGLAKLREIGAKVWRPYYLGLLASACGATGRPRAGLDALDEATSITEPAGEKDQEAEIHRLRGSLTLACDDRSSAEACFMRSLSIARAQGARTWELRAAVGLAQLWQEIGERAKARDLLAPVHAWFTEGFDGPDLRRSAALLDALG